MNSRRKHREYRHEDEEASVSAETYYNGAGGHTNGGVVSSVSQTGVNGTLEQQQRHNNQQLHQQYQQHQQQLQHQQQQHQHQQHISINGKAAPIVRPGQLKVAAASLYGRKPLGPLEGGLAVMYDYDQIARQNQRSAMSPEALKVRRAPAVLQPPTIV